MKSKKWDLLQLDLSNVPWRKSSYSGNQGSECVEVALAEDRIALRDSKDPQGPALVFTASEWKAFLAGAKDGEFDLT